MRVVDDLGDLHELDAGRNTVKTGHSVPQLLGEEAFRCFLRVPEAYAKVSLKKYKTMAARNEDRNVYERPSVVSEENPPGFKSGDGPLDGCTERADLVIVNMASRHIQSSRPSGFRIGVVMVLTIPDESLVREDSASRFEDECRILILSAWPYRAGFP